MSRIPKKLLAELLLDPFYKICTRKGEDCDGRITFEHALIFAGKQVQERFAIIPLCTYHHAVNGYQDGGDLNKNMNLWIALSRATAEELTRYSKARNLKRELVVLTNLFGQWKHNQPSYINK